MGNQLTGAAPSQILPVETYVSDIPGTTFVRSLGNTRFFKVARISHVEGDVVAKVFVIHDQTLSLKAYSSRILHLRKKLVGVYNALPYEKTIMLEMKAAIILRPFMNMSLLERIHSRPFLTLIEKKWIAFQLLCALSQCHGVEVFHGDIKSENVLLTSWGWLMLSDFAVFKPAYLPADNPTDFAYFYDTSSRGSCYIAPERFVATNTPCCAEELYAASRDELEAEGGGGEMRGLEQPAALTGEVNAAMDLFSVGCVMLELFTDGRVPFDLGHLLAYRNGDYSPDGLLNLVSDPTIREIIEMLLRRDPTRRSSAEDILIHFRGRCFPECFYSYLKSAMHIGSASEPDLLHSDDRMFKTFREWPSMKRALVTDPDNPTNESLLIMVNAITALSRSLHFSQVKLMALELMVRCAAYIPFEWVLDRIVPFILDFVGDNCDQIRKAVPAALVAALSPRCGGSLVGVDAEANIFPEFIFPALQPLVRDRRVGVRCTYASHIADLCHMALDFLQSVDMHRGKTGATNIEQAGSSYDEEVTHLRQVAEAVLVPFLTDQHNAVRLAVVGGLAKLCCFLGVVKSTDVLLSHMITFLNDKEDPRLRATFFDNVFPVVSYVGRHAADMIEPLLERGLSDPQPAVLVAALSCLAQLVSVRLLALDHSHRYLSWGLPLLAHPSPAVRRAAVTFAAAAGRVLPPWEEFRLLQDSDQETTWLGLHLAEPLESLQSEEGLFDALCPPVPEEVFDVLCKLPEVDLQRCLQLLEERRVARAQTRSGQPPNYPMMEEPLCALHRKLCAFGMTPLDEDRLCRLRELLLRVRASSGPPASADMLVMVPSGPTSKVSGRNELPGIDIDALIDGPRKARSPVVQRALSPERRASAPLALVGGREINKEWQQLFLGPTRDSSPSAAANRATMTGSTAAPALVTPQPPTELTKSTPDAALPSMVTRRDLGAGGREKNIVRYSSSYVYAYNLSLHRREQLQALAQADDGQVGQWEQVSTRAAWRPQGVLLGDLHEHTGAIAQLGVRPQGDFFYTVGHDACVKFWDWGPNIHRDDSALAAGSTGSADTERALTYRSRLTQQLGSPLLGLVFLRAGAELVTCAGDKVLHALTTDTGVEAWRADVPSSRGHVTALSGRPSDSLVFATTTSGEVLAWDARTANRPAFCMSAGSASPLLEDRSGGAFVGLLISLSVYSPHKWLTTGSTLGVMTSFDLRFRRPVCSTQHPDRSAIHRLEVLPGERSIVVAAAHGNNELSWWDMETQMRKRTLWASSSPPLSRVPTSPARVCCAFHVVSNVTSGGEQSISVITGSTDMRLRYWDFQHADNCRLLARRYTDAADVSDRVSYESRMVEGTQVVRECYGSRQPTVEHEPASLQDPHWGHKDAINDLVVANVGQPILVTAARDGVIKLWK